MTIEREALGKAVRQIRELRGFSQAALAEEAGLRGNSVALIERGQRGVSIETLNALAEALELPAACLTILGTSKPGVTDGGALVKSLQKLIVATVAAQARLDNQKTTKRASRSSPVRRKKSTAARAPIE